MKPVAALTVAVWALAAQTGRPAIHTVSAIRHWNNPGGTRIAVEVSGEFEYRSDRLSNPDRVYYDILNSRPHIESRRVFSEDLDGKFVRRIRVAETMPGVTRIVLDLNGSVDVSASRLSNPERLIIEIRAAGRPAAIPTESSAAAVPDPAPIQTVPPSAMPSSAPAKSSTPLPPAVKSAGAPVKTMPAPLPVKAEPAAEPAAEPNQAQLTSNVATPSATVSEALKSDPVRSAETVRPASTGAETAKPARRTGAGETSLVRALGLKIQRVVIDPGHGGHDEGTQGPHGLLEKDVVLDVGLRVGKLIEQQMGAEVIYTRSDDTFIPLEGRTAIANEKKADLFLSVHANSSPAPQISGVETYYLNFSDSKDALNIASRENATSQKSVFELRDLIQKISLHDKAEESRDFASRIQAALFNFSARNFPNEKNRGVKKAPFVVLIGANMPSVLAEIGFLSNPREEALLKKAEYRQKLAEALYRGVSRYAESLSHFQVAQNQAQDSVKPE
jgi:N-acetylmuramoyl-L-alanine amidase